MDLPSSLVSNRPFVCCQTPAQKQKNVIYRYHFLIITGVETLRKGGMQHAWISTWKAGIKSTVAEVVRYKSKQKRQPSVSYFNYKHLFGMGVRGDEQQAHRPTFVTELEQLPQSVPPLLLSSFFLWLLPLIFLQQLCKPGGLESAGEQGSCCCLRHFLPSRSMSETRTTRCHCLGGIRGYIQFC